MQGQYTLDQIKDALRRRQRKAWGEFPELGVDTVVALLAELEARDKNAVNPVDAVAEMVGKLIEQGNLTQARTALDRVKQLLSKLGKDLAGAIDAAEKELEAAKKGGAGGGGDKT